jgi:hypothetical protein
MHRSCLAGFIIDCRTDDLPGAAAFWAGALGMPPQLPQPANNDGRYVTLENPDLHIEVQQVEHDSRVHLDIQTDDIEAEVQRLEGLGARRVANVRTWVVMEAPTGQRFCVVRVQGDDFARRARVWND